MWFDGYQAGNPRHRVLGDSKDAVWRVSADCKVKPVSRILHHGKAARGSIRKDSCAWNTSVQCDSCRVCAFLQVFLRGVDCSGRDLSTIGDTVLMSVSKEGIKFSSSGDIGSANITVRQAITAHYAKWVARECTCNML